MFGYVRQPNTTYEVEESKASAPPDKEIIHAVVLHIYGATPAATEIMLLLTSPSSDNCMSVNGDTSHVLEI